MAATAGSSDNNPAFDADEDNPSNPAHEFAQFGAGCFWGVELAFQRVEGVQNRGWLLTGNLLSVFWERHDPTTLNRQGGNVGAQYRSGIYYYNENQARLARAEEYHQQYLEKGGRFGAKQSADKGCTDPIRCYG
ncbi:vignain-like [Hibiscus syriacus]|uniref:peptide-methionine (S)-S-oxide reductase n=1 Tax=Hibiscus syriacus TaxID=106335 RepID=A0A6A2ZZ04_HIBSY|nr:vignain-like [Hibiscus syriacus]